MGGATKSRTDPGNRSPFEPREMPEDSKRLCRKILCDFIKRYPFNPDPFPPEGAAETREAK